MSKFEIYKDNSDAGEECWRWKLKDSNGKKIARGGEAFVKGSIKESIKTLKENANIHASVFLNESKDDTDIGYRFEYEQSDKNTQWYWRFKSGNNKIMAIGGDGFSSKQSILGSIENVKLEIGRAEISFKDPEDDPAYQARKDDSTESKGIPGS